MRKLTLAISMVTFCVAAPAQQVLQCVNADVLNSLVFNARAESKLVVRRTMPDTVDGFRAPAGFTLIGSGVRGQNLSTVVAYKTTLETTAAFDSLMGLLSAEGWKRESTSLQQQPLVSVAGPQPAAARLCRNGQRRNMLVQEIQGVRYATIFGFEATPPRACDAPMPQQGFGVDPIAAFNARRAILPQFTFPDTARLAPAAGGEVFSGNSASTSARIESPDTAASLARHLSRQLVEQGWRSDAQWSGKLSTGSTWSRSNADGQTIWGTLEILSRSAGIYDVGFTLATRQL